MKTTYLILTGIAGAAAAVYFARDARLGIPHSKIKNNVLWMAKNISGEL